MHSLKIKEAANCELKCYFSFVQSIFYIKFDAPVLGSIKDFMSPNWNDRSPTSSARNQRVHHLEDTPFNRLSIDQEGA